MCPGPLRSLVGSALLPFCHARSCGILPRAPGGSLLESLSSHCLFCQPFQISSSHSRWSPLLSLSLPLSLSFQQSLHFNIWVSLLSRSYNSLSIPWNELSSALRWWLLAHEPCNTLGFYLVSMMPPPILISGSKKIYKWINRVRKTENHVALSIKFLKDDETLFTNSTLGTADTHTELATCLKLHILCLE